MLLKTCAAALIIFSGALGATTTVVQSTPIPDKDFLELAELYKTRGSDAVVDYLNLQFEIPERLVSWQEFARRKAEGQAQSVGPVKNVRVDIHTDEQGALDYLNGRFERMGLSNLKFEGLETQSDPKDSPHYIDQKSIRAYWWARLLGSPGLGFATYLATLPPATGHSLHDYVLLILPGATVGVMTILVELTFVLPQFNQYWAKLWRFGGQTMGRVWSWGWNFAFVMMLYYSGKGGDKLARSFGAPPTQFRNLGDAVTAAIKNASFATLTIGQFAADISTAEKRGSINAVMRYMLETPLSVIVNGARIMAGMNPNLDWLNYTVMMLYLGMKTLPQTFKDAGDWLDDRRAFRRLDAERAPKVSFLESCAGALSNVRIMNLPRMRKAIP